jgi:hypothetical protein
MCWEMRELGKVGRLLKVESFVCTAARILSCPEVNDIYFERIRKHPSSWRFQTFKISRRLILLEHNPDSSMLRN